MIFEPITHIISKSEYEEKILIYIRLVEVLCTKHNITIIDSDLCNKSVVSELTDMGIISTEKDLSELKKLLKENYDRFLKCVNTYLSNKELFGNALDKLNNKKRRILQEKEKASGKPNFVDFFAGAGGLSCGFVQAGFRVVFANDHEDVCIRTYKYNHPELPAESVLKEDIRKIVDKMDDYVKEEVDIVVGGPPCQSFSSANQRRVIDDPRNVLYKYYIEAIKQLAPKIILMENVKGMLSVADQVIADYKAIEIEKNGKKYTYDVAYRLLNAVNFGVCQSRERLIFIAVRNDVAESKHISPEKIFAEIESTYSLYTPQNLQVALDFIKPLDAPRIKGQTETDDEKTGMKIGLNQYDSCGNNYLKRINGGRQIDFVFNHKARYCSDVNYEIFRRLGQGEDSTNPKIADIMPYANRNDIFKDKYYKLIANKPSRTITAHLKMDCLSHIHPTQIRSITPREAARVQSFPDDYLFLGAYLKTYMQIGNAVPVLMAKQIAEVIKKYL